MSEERLVYSKYGSGNKILFAFHGFGQNKSIFEDWEFFLGKEYSIYAFDLFYHGESTRPYEKLSKNAWIKIINDVIEKDQIADFSVIGYSLGGRFAIATAIELPEQTKELILIAPDGIFLTVWFKLATTPIIRLLFKYFMLNPDRLDKLIRFNEKNKIVNRYITDFVKKEMGSAANRKRVYVSWNYFKSLGYTKKQLIQAFQKHDFKRGIILGHKDHIIKTKKILPIIERMGSFNIEILNKKHHQLMDEEVAKLTAQIFKLEK